MATFDSARGRRSGMASKHTGPSFDDSLTELEATDPVVRKAAENLERVKREIVDAPMPDTFEAGYRAALVEAIHVCDAVSLLRPDNARRKSPLATYQAAACKCAWELRQKLNEPVPQRKRSR
jgi:hypothetical protein